ncbi:phospholipid scramblase 1-like isoform X1 [Ornithodoros turicata]|uniref:phospholipid scramblase 1-like isoform X1 n=1 Tax=Ornithodoros turicata TaxID=34597 RepID=UPI003138AF1E
MAEGEVVNVITKEPPMMGQEIGLNLLSKSTTLKLIKVKEFPRWIYTVLDAGNRDLFGVYNGTEDCAGCCRSCVFGPVSASFTAYMKQSNIVDSLPVMSFERPLRLQSGLKGFFCCCLGQEMNIEAPPGRRIASISEDYNILGTSLTIYDAKGKPILKVLGPTLPPYSPCAMRLSIFKVQTMTGTLVGEIRLAGSKEELISLSFPVNLDVHIKGSLIGCAILAAFMFRLEGFTYTCCQVFGIFADLSK